MNDYQKHQETTRKATEYKGIVDSALSNVEVGSIKTVVDDVEIEYKPSKEALEAVRAIYANPKAFNTFAGEVTVDTLTEAMKTNVIMTDFNKFVSEISQSYHAKMVEKHQLGRRGLDGVWRTGVGEGPYNPSSSGGGTSNKVADNMLNEKKKAS